MSDLPVPVSFYIIPRGADYGDPLAQLPETLGIKFEVDGQLYGALIQQDTLERAGVKIVAPYGSPKGRLDIVAERLVEGAAPPRRQ